MKQENSLKLLINLTLSDYIFYKMLVTFTCYLSTQGYWLLVVGRYEVIRTSNQQL